MLSAGPKCVLVIDDDDEIRDVVGEILKFGGYRVALAANGEQALAQIRAVHPDAIILDLLMPVMDGMTFLQNCRASLGRGARPVVVMTAYQRLRETAASELHVQGVLPKPFELEALLDTVDRVLQASAKRQRAKLPFGALRRRASRTHPRTRPHTVARPGRGASPR